MKSGNWHIKSMQTGGARLNVLIITPFFSPNIGGQETHLNDLCEYLSKRGHAVRVITYQPLTTKTRACSYQKLGDVEVRRVQWFSYGLLNVVGKYPALEFLYLFPGLFLSTLFYLLRKNKEITVMHAHGLAASAVTFLLSKIFKKGYLISLHWIVGIRRKRWLGRIMIPLLNRSQVVLTLSKASKNDLLEAYPVAEKVKISRYWINLQKFKPLVKNDARKLLKLKDDDFYVLFVGRLIEVKGVRVAIEIARRLQSYNNIHMILVGDGPLRKEVEEASKSIRTLTFLGPVENLKLPLYYSASDIVIVPSLHEEGYGRVIMESLSCSTPVIASNRGGIPEVVNGSVGFIVEPRPEEFMTKIKRFIAHQEELLELANNCRKYAEEIFSERNAMLIENSYIMRSN